MSSVQLSSGSAVFVPALMTFMSYQISTRVARAAAEHFKFVESTERIFEYGLMLSLSAFSSKKIVPLFLIDKQAQVALAIVINACATALLSLYILVVHISKQQDTILTRPVMSEEWTSVRTASKLSPQKGFDEIVRKIDDFFKRPANQSILIQADSSSPYLLLIQECARRIYQGKLPADSALKGKSLFYLQASAFAGRSQEDLRSMVKFYESKNAIVVVDKFEKLSDEYKWVWQHLEPSIEAGRIAFIGIAPPEQYSALITAIPFVQRLNTLDVPPLDAEACFSALQSQQEKCLQYRPGITITEEALALATLFSYHYVIKGFSLSDALTVLSDVIQGLPADSKTLDSASFLTTWYKLYAITPSKISLSSIPASSTNFLKSKKVNVVDETDKILEANKKKKESRSDTRDVPPFMTDMVEMAREGHYAPCIGRDVEIDTVIRSLAQARQKSLVFTGPPGIGKTSVFEELARRIALKDDSVEKLHDLLVYEVDVAGLLSTEGYVGQLNTKVTAMINFSKRRKGQVALVIDELHQLRGAGRYKGNENDLFEMLKNALARDEIIILGTTNNYRWDPIVREDPAIERRIKTMQMAPPDAETCKQMLTTANQQGFYTKDAPLVKLSDEAIACAVNLTARLKDRHYPDKAIVLLSDVVSNYQLLQERNRKGAITIGKREVELLFKTRYPAISI